MLKASIGNLGGLASSPPASFPIPAELLDSSPSAAPNPSSRVPLYTFSLP
ncbi:predicted protein [Botrytis cinerea T4]|uniref:Uncharacterized protein n=1 Tax=Botryotinia fuckeliana (strain T4) TaxID=999810 RepID=G2XVH2_BOTF4|nr:predicted protein [Botrytis cinerea T4]